MKVPLLDLKPQLAQFRDEIVEAMARVVDSTGYILGPEVTDLERAVADYCGVSDGIGVSSGTDALLMSLMALDVGPGDQVLTTPYTFFATVGSIVRVGAQPVFVDIEHDTMNIDTDQVAEALARDRRGDGRIKAIMPVHLFGQCADMTRIRALAEEYGVAVIEDAAQAIGAECPVEIDGQVVWKRAGAMGTMGCFSFFPSKNLGGVGDGGMVVTGDGDLAEHLRIYRNHGAFPKYYHKYVGGNFRLDPIQAAVLSIKLPHLEAWHAARRKNSEMYHRLFAEAGLLNEPLIAPRAIYQNAPGAAEHHYHIFNQFVIRVPQRDELRDFLLSKDVGCEIYYPLCLHQQECFKSYGCAAHCYPVAEKAASETLALPIYPELTGDMLAYVVEMIAEFYKAA